MRCYAACVLAAVRSAAVLGIDAYDVTVEVNALGQARLCVPEDEGKPMISGIPSCGS